jgi:hypothetical protein
MRWKQFFTGYALRRAPGSRSDEAPCSFIARSITTATNQRTARMVKWTFIWPRLSPESFKCAPENRGNLELKWCTGIHGWYSALSIRGCWRKWPSCYEDVSSTDSIIWLEKRRTANQSSRHSNKKSETAHTVGEYFYGILKGNWPSWKEHDIFW